MKARLLYIDNLRWVMIMLVVSMHAACTYSHVGSWYYMENRPVSAAETGIFATYQATLQSFFMGFLFFIAGYFVPGTFDKKGAGRFLRDRFYRLGIPLVFFVFVIQPVSIYCISLFHGEDVMPNGFLEGYAHYVTHYRWIGGTGPLWFCEALLILCLGYALFRVVKPKPAEPRPLPGKTGIWLFIIAITLCSFAVRFPWPVGTSFYNLQFCYCSQYVFFFAAGTLAFRGDWLNRLAKTDKRYWGRVALAGGLIVWPTLLLLGGAFKGNLTGYQGGMHWTSLGMAFWESMMGVSISLFLVVWFRERFNEQGRVAHYFSVNAFAVYVFHTPILIALSRWISPLQAPLLLMFLGATVLAILVTFAASSVFFRRLPLLKQIL